MLLRQPPEPRANRSQRPRRRCLGQPSLVELAEVRTDVEVLDGSNGGAGAEGVAEIGSEVQNLAAVGADRVLGCVAFVFDHCQELLGEVFELGGLGRVHGHSFTAAVRPDGMPGGGMAGSAVDTVASLPC